MKFPSEIIKSFNETQASKIIAFTFWFTFLFLHAFYVGALKMFFTTEVTIPFNDIRDVLKTFPSWNLIFADGNDIYFKSGATQVS